ncbi:retrovirus-related pol polyprotein from transposon TNT 1-94 [Tanacetum coccineum]
METKLDEVVLFENQTDDLKRRLAENNEAKMVIYTALPRKEYERIFMCNTAKENLWKEAFVITHQDEEYAMAVRDFKKFFKRRGRFVRQPRNDKKTPFKEAETTKMEKVKGSALDADRSKIHLIYWIIPKHRETRPKSIRWSSWNDENSSIDDLALDNEYDKLCKMSLKIITKNKRLKAIRNSLENELRELKDKLSILEKNKGVDLGIVATRKTPYELLRGRKPTLDYFRVFGSKCFILNTKDYLTKFDPKSYEGVFLGYSQNSKAYIILNKHTRKVKESLNVTFDETPPPSKTSPLVDDDLDEEEAIKVTEKKNLENDIMDETLEVDEIVNIKESRNHPLENVIGNLNQRTLRSQAQNQSNFFCFISTIEPKNVNEALGDDSWIVAMQEELNQFIANDVWELVPQPKNMTIIGTKWVFRNKLDENGIVSRNKARLVAQGYNQQEGIDYDETYAPVARLESIRILLAYACALDFKLFQMDVKSAFLNGFINEEVYVAQPPGFIDFEKPDHVYKLKKALYGLKQAPKAWYDRLKAFLIKHEYKMGMVDNTLFTKKKSSNLIIVQIYVDDIIFGLTYQDMCDEFAKIMHDEFEMSMMGELNFFLGLQIKQMEDDINEQIVLEFYCQLTFTNNPKGEFVVNFVIQNKSFFLTLEEFGQILKIPFKGHASTTEMWSLDHLSVSVPSRGLYKTKPPSPRVIKSLIQIPHQGQETRTKNKKTIVVGKNKILTREIQTHMKPWVEIIRENTICLGGHRDHVSACLCHMLYCIETSTPYNLAFFILKRMEKTRFKPKKLLPYGMLLTRLFKHVVSVSPELAFDHFLSHDRAMHPLAPHYERKTRADRGKERSRGSNASSSSTTLNHPSSSLPLDHIVDENDDESFHSNSSSPSLQISSSSNVASRVRQNSSHESRDLNTLLSEMITFETQQRDAHRDGLRSIGQALKNIMGGKRK